MVKAVAAPVISGDFTFNLAHFADRAVVAVDPAGGEYLRLNTGTNWLRIDLVEGSVLGGPVALRWCLPEPTAIAHQYEALARLLQFFDMGERCGIVAPNDTKRMAMLVDALRAGDALDEGASLKSICAALRGSDAVAGEWPGDGDYLKSWVRRRVVLARKLRLAGPRGVLAATL